MNEGIYIIIYMFVAPFIVTYFLFMIISTIILFRNREKIKQKYQTKILQTCTSKSNPLLLITEFFIMTIILTKKLSTYAATILSYSQYEHSPFFVILDFYQDYKYNVWFVLLLVDLIIVLVTTKKHDYPHALVLFPLAIFCKTAYLLPRAYILSDTNAMKRALIFVGIRITLFTMELLAFTIYVISIIIQN